MPGKQLTIDEQGRVVAALRRLLAERYDNNQSALMRAYPKALRQSYVSKMLRGESVPGWGFARKLAMILGTTPEALVSGSAGPALGPRFRDIPTWEAASRDAITIAPDLEEAIHAAAEMHMPEKLSRITVGSVVELALFWTKAKKLAGK